MERRESKSGGSGGPKGKQREVVVGSGKLRAYIREIGKSERELKRSEGWTERREGERKREAGVSMYPAGEVERAGRCVFAP